MLTQYQANETSNLKTPEFIFENQPVCIEVCIAAMQLHEKEALFLHFC